MSNSAVEKRKNTKHTYRQNAKMVLMHRINQSPAPYHQLSVMYHRKPTIINHMLKHQKRSCQSILILMPMVMIFARLKTRTRYHKITSCSFFCYFKFNTSLPGSVFKDPNYVCLIYKKDKKQKQKQYKHLLKQKKKTPGVEQNSQLYKPPPTKANMKNCLKLLLWTHNSAVPQSGAPKTWAMGKVCSPYQKKIAPPSTKDLGYG